MTPRIEAGRGWTMYLGDCLEIMPTLDAVDNVTTVEAARRGQQSLFGDVAGRRSA